ncbi:hypothetical protein G0Q06_12335 [Puniceicoccales bacterium CK1056]|uniref:Uncharacterized protein n=1 Tax=Oceanipulchritudo coccoides TaxID=2706888 RepID=A0A6B2M621_9BACT|nr:hypothetical protein [Oceanipulchritudo coccoides]NDV63245.1 hypothetical protein [Oceanipulchritudo coccoides]
MSLTDEQKSSVAAWIREGASLSDVQKRLETEMDVRITYMDLRFLVDDLDLEIKAVGPQFDDPKVEEVGSAQAGKVSVTLDKVTRPDALVSGQVTFSDGVSAQWHLDQMGRLSLNAKQPGYKPSQEDLQDFQNELRQAVEKSGMM